MNSSKEYLHFPEEQSSETAQIDAAIAAENAAEKNQAFIAEDADLGQQLRALKQLAATAPERQINDPDSQSPESQELAAGINQQIEQTLSSDDFPSV